MKEKMKEDEKRNEKKKEKQKEWINKGKSQEKTWGRRNEMQKVLFLFLERESLPSL